MRSAAAGVGAIPGEVVPKFIGHFTVCINIHQEILHIGASPVLDSDNVVVAIAVIRAESVDSQSPNHLI